MKIARCRFDGADKVAIVTGSGLAILDGVDSVSAACDPAAAEAAIVVRDVPLDAVRFLTPVERPGKIICVGVNYPAHAAEGGRAAAAPAPAHPSLFVRFPQSQVAHDEPIVAPSISEQFDFEGELAVVIGKSAWRITSEQALGHVAGYCCFAENSVRDFQKHAAQITPGKNFRASGAFGPWIASADEVGNPRELKLTTRLNGEVMQQDLIGSMIFPVEELVAYISQFTELLPGDVIATGTPAGVGGARNPPIWMKPGDTLEVEIERVGLLRNPVTAE